MAVTSAVALDSAKDAREIEEAEEALSHSRKEVERFKDRNRALRGELNELRESTRYAEPCE